MGLLVNFEFDSGGARWNHKSRHQSAALRWRAERGSDDPHPLLGSLFLLVVVCRAPTSSWGETLFSPTRLYLTVCVWYLSYCRETLFDLPFFQLDAKGGKELNMNLLFLCILSARSFTEVLYAKAILFSGWRSARFMAKLKFHWCKWVSSIISIPKYLGFVLAEEDIITSSFKVSIWKGLEAFTWKDWRAEINKMKGYESESPGDKMYCCHIYL